MIWHEVVLGAGVPRGGWNGHVLPDGQTIQDHPGAVDTFTGIMSKSIIMISFLTTLYLSVDL